MHLDDDRQDRYGRRDHRDRDHKRQPPNEQRHEQRPAYQGVPTGPRADRGKETPTGPRGSGASTPASASSMPPPPLPNSANGSLNAESQEFVPPMTDKDLTAIRSRYLGVDKKKRKIRKMNDRKFVFDWDEQDDTFSAEAPAAVGSNRQGAQIMFGRGHIAGMDDGGGVAHSRKSDAESGLQMADALERRKAAKSGLDERHWTEKPLEEMKERDWRILREDFNIAARGT